MSAGPSAPRAPAAMRVNSAHASAPYYRDTLTIVLRELGWDDDREVRRPQGRAGSEPALSVVWWDEPIKRPHLLMLGANAVINRFYAMVRVCRKCCLARLLHACARLDPNAYADLAPRSWCVGRAWPDSVRAFGRAAERLSSSTTYIVKPDNGCQGAGISLVRSVEELRALLAAEDAPPRVLVQVRASRAGAITAPGDGSIGMAADAHARVRRSICHVHSCCAAPARPTGASSICGST